MRTERKETIRSAVRVLFLVVLAYYCLAFLIPRWSSLRLSERVGELSVVWIAASAALMLLHHVWLASMWAKLLRVMGASLRFEVVLRAFVLAMLPRYLPGKLPALGVRAHLVIKSGAAASAAAASLLWETALAIGTGVLIAVAGTYLSPRGFGWSGSSWSTGRIGVAVIAGAALLVIARVVWVRMSSHRVGEWLGLSQLKDRGRAMFGIALQYLIGWLFPGLVHLLLLNAITPVGPVALLPLTGAVAASWIAGAISVFAPAGLGVREGVLFVMLWGWLGESDAILFVTLSRVLMFLVEALMTLAWVVVARFSSR